MLQAIYEERWFLVALFLCALALRVGVFTLYLGEENRFLQVDSNTYHLIGTEIARGNGYTLPGSQTAFYRLPGYPFFLSVCYTLFGHSQHHAMVAQTVIASIIPFLVFMLSLALFPTRRRLAKVSAAVSACHLGLVLYSGFFMTETLFLLFFLLFALCFTLSFHLFFCSKARTKQSNQPPKDLERFFSQCTGQDSPYSRTTIAHLPDPLSSSKSFMEPYARTCIDMQETCTICASYANTTIHRRMQLLLLAGLFLGFASMVRPIGHYLIVVAAALLMFQHKPLYAKLYNAAALFIGWIMPVSFLLLRNYILAGALFFHTLPGGHFLYLSAARVAMHPYKCSYQQARTILRDEVEKNIATEEKTKGRTLNEIERCKVHEKLACHYFTSYPLHALRYWTTDMFRTMFSLYSAELLYLDSGRKDIDYFAKDRTVWSMFKRYIMPETRSIILKFIVWAEIIFFLLMLLGFFYGLFYMVARGTPGMRCSWIKVLPIIALFIVISLAGGYARMRLPIEPFLIILSLYGWMLLFNYPPKHMHA